MILAAVAMLNPREDIMMPEVLWISSVVYLMSWEETTKIYTTVRKLSESKLIMLWIFNWTPNSSSCINTGLDLFQYKLSVLVFYKLNTTVQTFHNLNTVESLPYAYNLLSVSPKYTCFTLKYGSYFFLLHSISANAIIGQCLLPIIVFLTRWNHM